MHDDMELEVDVSKIAIFNKFTVPEKQWLGTMECWMQQMCIKGSPGDGIAAYFYHHPACHHLPDRPHYPAFMSKFSLQPPQ